MPPSAPSPSDEHSAITAVCSSKSNASVIGTRRQSSRPVCSSSSKDEGSLKAPMPGTVLQVLAKVGQRVRDGQHLMTLEAMKMEHKVVAPKAGEITKVNYAEGERVDMGLALVEIGD